MTVNGVKVTLGGKNNQTELFNNNAPIRRKMAQAIAYVVNACEMDISLSGLVFGNCRGAVDRL